MDGGLAIFCSVYFIIIQKKNRTEPAGATAGGATVHCPVACGVPWAAGRGEARDTPSEGRSCRRCPGTVLCGAGCELTLLPGGTEGFSDFPSSDHACAHSHSSCLRVTPGGQLQTNGAGLPKGMGCPQPALWKPCPLGSHFCQRLSGPHVRLPGFSICWSAEWETVSCFSCLALLARRTCFNVYWTCTFFSFL